MALGLSLGVTPKVINTQVQITGVFVLSDGSFFLLSDNTYLELSDAS